MIIIFTIARSSDSCDGSQLLPHLPPHAVFAPSSWGWWSSYDDDAASDDVGEDFIVHHICAPCDLEVDHQPIKGSTLKTLNQSIIRKGDIQSNLHHHHHHQCNHHHHPANDQECGVLAFNVQRREQNFSRMLAFIFLRFTVYLSQGNVLVSFYLYLRFRLYIISSISSPPSCIFQFVSILDEF